MALLQCHLAGSGTLGVALTNNHNPPIRAEGTGNSSARFPLRCWTTSRGDPFRADVAGLGPVPGDRIGRVKGLFVSLRLPRASNFRRAECKTRCCQPAGERPGGSRIQRGMVCSNCSSFLLWRVSRSVSMYLHTSSCNNPGTNPRLACPISLHTRTGRVPLGWRSHAGGGDLRNGLPSRYPITITNEAQIVAKTVE